jgi:Na+/H+-translocating membrane pyrophosphatase
LALCWWNDTRSFSALAMNLLEKQPWIWYMKRRQFKNWNYGTGKPEYAKCVDISTKAAFARNDVTEF